MAGSQGIYRLHESVGRIGPNSRTAVMDARSVGTDTRKGKDGEMERVGKDEAGGMNDVSSVAYWYQAEPHRTFSIPSVGERVTRQG